MVPIVLSMTNPGVLRQLTKQRQHEIAAAAIHARGFGASFRGVRERVGWSLVGLGARLAIDPQVHNVTYGRGALSERRLRPSSSSRGP